MQAEERKEKTHTVEQTAERLTDKADRHFEMCELAEAIDCYGKVLRLISVKKELEEQTAWTLSAIGDCYFVMRDFKSALRHYIKAFNLPTGYANAYAQLRAGQVFYEQGNMEQARHYMLQAYLIEGDELFEDEDWKYFDLIKDDEMIAETGGQTRRPKPGLRAGLKKAESLLGRFLKDADKKTPQSRRQDYE